MSSQILDRLQEEKLQGLEALIRSNENAAKGGRGEEAAAIADFFVDEGIGMRQSLQRLWQHHWSMALAGKVPNQKQRAEKLFSLLEQGGQILRRGAEIARAFADASGQEVARLAPFEEQSKAFPTWVAECKARWEMLGRPRRPLNRDQIAESQAAYARGEGEPVSDAVARLEQGGPLVKE